MPLIAVAYLSSHFLSFLGNGILAVALPLIVLQTTGSPLSVGAVSTATAVPALLVGLCAGVLIDRVNRRTCSIISDLVSAAAVAAIPLVDMGNGLTIGWLVALAILGSFGDVPGMTARQVMVPAVARHSGVPLERLIGLRQSMTSAALVIGPAAAGALLTLFGGSTVLFVTAATSAAAALVTATLPRRLGSVESDAAEHDSMLGRLTVGATALRGSRFLISTVALTVGLAVALGGLQGLVLPLYFSGLSRPDLLGFVLTALAVGMLVGTTVFAGVSARMSRRRWLMCALTGTTAGFLLLATLVGPGWVFAGAALFGIGNSVLGAVLGVLQAQRIPDGIRGRVLSLQNACLQGAVPAGVGLAGLVAEWRSPVAAGLALFAFWLSVLVLAGAVSRQPAGI
ncbi:MFS transporter [Mycobacterium dioxanotrophicus]|uniref:MFS transporter n=1 Tax=Mycobacterium dioxanotrophicus TaxID=482462 RepID=A0A1Y0CCU6_9MYCO|nr:MFS transporter [Mycobacterium dioxanotrophicus]ART72942.1 MFS transporter [Mycobacterium dioxanotrophicus]